MVDGQDSGRPAGSVDHEPASDSKSAPTKSAEEREQQRAVHVKVTHVLLTVFLAWLTILHVIGALFFGKGFLLTRLVLDNRSQCTILPDGQPAPQSTGCWHPKSFDRAVVLIIDALRYDFTIPSHRSTIEPEQKFYLDNFPVLHEIAVSSPKHAFLLPFIADPPTTTLQRLKGLMTGTLPTFIDIGSNFAGTAIEEDNLIAHLKDAGKTVVHLGDDTWHALFPGYFEPNMTKAYDSFNVWDLHTVDNGVIDHIMPLLSNPPAKWDVIFGHFLGVDHAGHRYGPDHPAMAEKLTQMNTVMKQIIDKVDDDTLLVVMGDHGMDTKGDHGGESDEEVEAALWMYSRKPRFGRLDESSLLPPSNAKERPVGQIDLVSTLSLLLGLPIPFNNLGRPIAEAFTGPGTPDWKNLARVHQLAQSQIARYQYHYSRSRDLSVEETVSRTHAALLDTAHGASSRGQWRDAFYAYSGWQQKVIGMYRGLWANFHLEEMAYGIGISTVALVFLLLLARFSKGDKSSLSVGLLRISAFGSVVGGALGALLSVLLSNYIPVVTGSVLGASVSSVIAATIWAYQHQLIGGSLKPSTWGGMAAIFCLAQAAGFASNSYTIHEDTILLFFLTSFGIVALISSLRQVSKSDRVLGTYQSVVFICLTRLASFSRLCREEQMPGCRSTFYASSNSTTSAPWHLLIPFIVSLVLPEIIKSFYNSTASYAASAGFWMGFTFRLGLILIAMHWLIDASDNGDWLTENFSSSTLKTMGIVVARCTLAIAIPVGVGTFIWAKPCIDIEIAEPVRSPTSSAAVTPARPKVTIYGYANVYGTRYFLLIPVLILTITLLLPPMGQYSLAILIWQILCLLEILDTNNLTINARYKSSIGPIILALLGSYHFFKTGHQATLASIQWNSAFVPLRTIRYPWSPVLVILNTFGAQIICAAAVPLTVLWKRPTGRSSGLSRGIWNDVLTACLTHALYYATIALATTLWAGHLRRHLMLYRVFMPRYLMANAVLIIVDLVLVFIALGAVRVTGLSVGEVFGH